MTTEYPEGLDSFSVPSLPEDTPLSQAGPGNTRNLVESVRDQGDAIEALQAHAAQKIHDHSGDDDDTTKGAKLDQANTHENSDTDVGLTSKHHTLGIGQFQAAAGNHAHDYAGTTIFNKPYELCTSTSRPTPFLGKTIWEVDTNRMRIWAQFPGVQTAVQGTYGVDNFTRTSNLNLGPMWDQWYANANGVMATPTGNSAAWLETGVSYNRCIAQRVHPADRYTQSYDQVIIIDTNAETAEWDYPNPSNPAGVDAFFRMSDDKQEYIRASLTWWKGYTGHIMLTWTDSGPGGEQLIGTLPAPTNRVNISWQMRMISNRFEVYMGIERVGEIVDNEQVTTSLLNKGWGIGMQAGDPYPWGLNTQVKPSQIDFVTIADAVYFTSDARWQLLPVGVVPRVGLAGTAPQQINPTGSVIEWGHVEEDNFGMFDPGIPTSIRCKEAGIYQIHASLVWGTALRGDQAGIGILINDQQTAHQHWEFVRGFNYQPGFSQTTDVTAYVRLAEGDRVGVVAAHNGAYSQYTGHKKAPAEDIVQISRFFLIFHSP